MKSLVANTTTVNAIAILAISTTIAHATRHVNIDVDPGKFDSQQYTMSEFCVQYYRIPGNDTKVGFRIYNRENPEAWLETRGIIDTSIPEPYWTPADSTWNIDGVSVWPLVNADPSEVGSVYPIIAEVPGSPEGLDNIYELWSALSGGSRIFALRPNRGTVEFWIDLDSDLNETQKNIIIDSVLKWDRIPSGYDFSDSLTIYRTFHSSQGMPPNYEPGENKVWIIRGNSNLSSNGDTNYDNSTIELKTNMSYRELEDAADEEIMQAVNDNPGSPFYNTSIAEMPTPYITMARLQNFTDIDQYGFKVEGVWITRGWTTNDWSMYYPNADDGSGVFPESINPQDLIQQDSLDAQGSASSNLYEPPIANEEMTWSQIKRTYQ